MFDGITLLGSESVGDYGSEEKSGCLALFRQDSPERATDGENGTSYSDADVSACCDNLGSHCGPCDTDRIQWQKTGHTKQTLDISILESCAKSTCVGRYRCEANI